MHTYVWWHTRVRPITTKQAEVPSGPADMTQSGCGAGRPHDLQAIQDPRRVFYGETGRGMQRNVFGTMFLCTRKSIGHPLRMSGESGEAAELIFHGQRVSSET